jgi:hypothetical protein
VTQRPFAVVCSGIPGEVCHARTEGTWNPTTGEADLPERWISRPPFGFCPDHHEGVLAVNARLPKTVEEADEMGREGARAIIMLRAHADPAVQAAGETLLTVVAAMSDDMLTLRRQLHHVVEGVGKLALTGLGRDPKPRLFDKLLKLALGRP